MNYFTIIITIMLGFNAVNSEKKLRLAESCASINYTWKPKIGCYKIYKLGDYINQHKNWTEARKTCVNDGADLVYVYNVEDARQLNKLTWKNKIWRTWTGVHRNGDGNWLTGDSENAIYDPKGCDENIYNYVDNSSMSCYFKYDRSEESRCLVFYSLHGSTALNALDCKLPIESFVCRINFR